jgi:hypothetical protein
MDLWTNLLDPWEDLSLLLRNRGAHLRTLMFYVGIVKHMVLAQSVVKVSGTLHNSKKIPTSATPFACWG